MNFVTSPGRQNPMQRVNPKFRPPLGPEMVAIACLLTQAVASARADEDSASPPREKSPDVVATWLERTSASGESIENQTIKRNKAPAPHSSQRADGGLTSLPYGKMLWPLAAVLGTIGLTAWLLRKWAGGNGRLGSSGAITVLSRHYLSSKQSLCLVRLGRRIVLLGVTPEHITAVADLGNSDEAAAIVAGLERSRSGSFTNALAGFSRSPFSESKNDDANETALDETSGRVQGLVDRLKACGAGT